MAAATETRKGCNGNKRQNVAESKKNVTETTARRVETMRGCNGNQAKLQRKPKRDVTEITENLNRNLQKPATERRTRRARLFFSWHAKAVLQVLLDSVALRDTRGLSASRACRARVEGSGLRAQGKPQNPQPLQPVARISAEQADWNFFK